jgi:phosphoribosyl 1,2-cyclic phosphate phosphodiesterase
VSLRLTFLGTGTSHGVPVIGCDCLVCTSTDPHNHRMRASAFVEWDGVSYLIDTATELRLQALRARLRRVDCILFTHSHADHIFGLDDVRRFNDIQHSSIPCYGAEHTLTTIKRQFSYIFERTTYLGAKPRLEAMPLQPGVALRNNGHSVLPVPVVHGHATILGYRFGPLAYVTDCSELPADSAEMLRGVDTLVINALRDRPHPTHFSISQALTAIEQIRPRQAYLTHMCHEVDHESTNRRLPAGVQLAYDTLSVTVEA